jgi:uncharacterized protein (TIGR02421 family)
MNNPKGHRGMKPKALTPYQQTVRELSERIVKAQQPIRVLDALKWNQAIQQDFFANGCQKLPAVTLEYYQKNPLPYDPNVKSAEFYTIERDIRRLLGQFSTVGNIMLRMCREYRELIRMLKHRGEPEFAQLSQQLYGGSTDAFHAGEPNLKDLSEMISATLTSMENHFTSEYDKKIYNSEQAVKILSERLTHYFHHAPRPITVKLSDGIVADAAAGADTIKIRTGATFSERELRVMEIHEGWVHIGTTFNGLIQPICTFLSKGPPSSTVTQEGLAILMEIFTFSSFPNRVKRLTDRITAIHMAEQGANFLEVFNFYRERGISEEESYGNTTRVFRGSLPDGGPFTKDLVYSKGLIIIFTYIQLAVEKGMLSRIPLLFTGKTTLQDVKSIADLIEEGLVVPPKFIPPQFADLGALAAWMCYSNFIRKIDRERVALDYRDVL